MELNIAESQQRFLGEKTIRRRKKGTRFRAPFA